MKKQDGERIAVLETKVDSLEKDQVAWNTLVKKIVLQFFIWVGGIAISGIAFGWHLPENTRKTIADWISK